VSRGIFLESFYADHKSKTHGTQISLFGANVCLSLSTCINSNVYARLFVNARIDERKLKESKGDEW
jgi:hypothetical protein